MRYDVIIFDLGNVVIKFDHGISAGKFAKKFGLDKDYIYDLFFDSKFTRLHDKGRLSSYEFYRKIKKALGINIKFGEFKDCWNDIFYLNGDIDRLIRRLKKNHKVYLLSNTNKLHFEFIKNKFKVIGNFDRLILSYKVGEMKPSPRIYRHAIKLAGTTPEKVLYVDDRKDLVESARALGIRSIRFQELGHLKKILKRLIKNPC